jgi:hypothetical protein
MTRVVTNGKNVEMEGAKEMEKMDGLKIHPPAPAASQVALLPSATVGLRI